MAAQTSPVSISSSSVNPAEIDDKKPAKAASICLVCHHLQMDFMGHKPGTNACPNRQDYPCGVWREKLGFADNNAARRARAAIMRELQQNGGAPSSPAPPRPKLDTPETPPGRRGMRVAIGAPSNLDYIPSPYRVFEHAERHCARTPSPTTKLLRALYRDTHAQLLRFKFALVARPTYMEYLQRFAWDQGGDTPTTDGPEQQGPSTSHSGVPDPDNSDESDDQPPLWSVDS